MCHNWIQHLDLFNLKNHKIDPELTSKDFAQVMKHKVKMYQEQLNKKVVYTLMCSEPTNLDLTTLTYIQ